MAQMNFSTKQRRTDIEIRPMVSKGKWGEGENGRGVGVGRCKWLHLEWINNKVLLYSTGNYIQSPEINHNEKNTCKKCLYVYTECSNFTASYFRTWNGSTGIPSPPLALFLVMLPKAHLTLHSKMSGSRWVIIPSWLSGLWRSFFV